MISYRRRIIAFKEKGGLNTDVEKLPFNEREALYVQAKKQADEKAREAFFVHVREHIGNEAYRYEQARYDAIAHCNRTVLGYFVTEHALTFLGRDYTWKTTALNYNLFEKGIAGLTDLRTIALAPTKPSITDKIIALAFQEVSVPRGGRKA